MTPKHFHMGAAVLLGLSAGYCLWHGYQVASGLLSLGALVALIHSKAAKAGIIDNS